MDFLGRELTLYADGRATGTIRIEGVSTASDAAALDYDFTYSGDPIAPEQLGEAAVLTDGNPEAALRNLAVA